MDITLTPEMEAMIREHVKSGRYATPNDVVQEAMRLLEAEEQKRDRLREKLAEGIAQIERGEFVVVNEAFWDRIDQEVADRIAREQSHVGRD